MLSNMSKPYEITDEYKEAFMVVQDVLLDFDLKDERRVCGALDAVMVQTPTEIPHERFAVLVGDDAAVDRLIAVDQAELKHVKTADPVLDDSYRVAGEKTLNFLIESGFGGGNEALMYAVIEAACLNGTGDLTRKRFLELARHAWDAVAAADFSS